MECADLVMQEKLPQEKQMDRTGFTIEEIWEGQRKPERFGKQCEKKWLFIGIAILLIGAVFIWSRGRSETELSNYIGMTQSRLGKALDIEYAGSGEGYTLYSAKEESIFIEVLDSDQCVHCIASRNGDYTLFGLNLGIPLNDLQHGLEQSGFNADRVYEEHGFFSRGQYAVGYTLYDNHITSAWTADSESIVVHELIGLGKRYWMKFA